MSMIIFSQSLKNEDPHDFSIGGVFPPPPEKLVMLNEFFAGLAKVGFKDADVDTVQVKNLQGSRDYYFKIYCEQKDSANRDSPIVIRAGLDELDMVSDFLDKFLEDCGKKGSGQRTVCDDVKNKLRYRIMSLMKSRNDSLLRGLIAAAAIIALLTILFGGKKS